MCLQNLKLFPLLYSKEKRTKVYIISHNPANICKVDKNNVDVTTQNQSLIKYTLPYTRLIHCMQIKLRSFFVLLHQRKVEIL